MKFTNGFMIHPGQPARDFIDYAVRHVLLHQGVLEIKVKPVGLHTTTACIGDCGDLGAGVSGQTFADVLQEHSTSRTSSNNRHTCPSLCWPWSLWTLVSLSTISSTEIRIRDDF
jgi:hypothetical protein